MEYSPEQREDIINREKQALDHLKVLHLTPAISMQAVNIGNDTFAMKPVPFLQDTKYSPASPIQA